MLHALTIASPGKKLIFMAHNFGQSEGWHRRLEDSYENGEIKPGTSSAVAEEQAENPLNKNLENRHKELNELYLHEPAFWEGEQSSDKGMRYFHFNEQTRVLSFQRYTKAHSILCVFNFSQHERMFNCHAPSSKVQILFRSHATNGFSPTETQMVCMPALSAVYLKMGS